MKKKIKNKYTLKFTLGIFIFASFFVFLNIADARTASVDTLPLENEAKVCKDVTCSNPKPGIIYFKVSSDFPLVVDTEKGLSGKVWGDELGWVTFNPPYGGVFFADPATGLLKGTAWSENSGAINFSVTGQKVVIDPKTGEWSGWAWASGPYGGWIKFDCADPASCVRTVWNTLAAEKPASPAPAPANQTTEAKTTIKPSISPAWTSNIKIKLNNILASIFTWTSDVQVKINNIFGKIAQVKNNIFTSLASGIGNFFRQMVAIKEEMTYIIAHKFINTFSSLSPGHIISSAYNALYSGFIKFVDSIFGFGK